VTGYNWVNQGARQASTGGILNCTAASRDRCGAFANTGGTINIHCLMTTTGGTLALTTGSITLNSDGTISNCIITTTGGAQLAFEQRDAERSDAELRRGGDKRDSVFDEWSDAERDADAEQPRLLCEARFPRHADAGGHGTSDVRLQRFGYSDDLYAKAMAAAIRRR